MDVAVPANWIFEPLFLRKAQRRFDLGTDVSLADPAIQISHKNYRGNLFYQRPISGFQIWQLRIVGTAFVWLFLLIYDVPCSRGIVAAKDLCQVLKDFFGLRWIQLWLGDYRGVIVRIAIRFVRPRKRNHLSPAKNPASAIKPGLRSSWYAWLRLAARRFAPSRFFIQRRLCEASQRVNRPSVRLNRSRRQKGAGRLVHKRHELVGKARHRTPDADAANIRASANAAHPATLSDITLDHRAPTSQLHD